MSYLRAVPGSRSPRALRPIPRAEPEVSDEFTVPLCAVHHHHIHTTGQERDRWRERNIDPLVVARDLWRRSRERDPARREPNLSERLEDQAEQNDPAGDYGSKPDAAAAVTTQGAERET